MDKKRSVKRILAAFSAAVICFAAFCGFIPAATAETETGTVSVEAQFHNSSLDRTESYTFEYNDGWFSAPASEYSHKLARISLGMALSAFRPNLRHEGDLEPEVHLRQFLTDCGFRDLRTDDYDKEPSLYTVATELGYKELRDEEGDYVLDLAPDDELRHARGVARASADKLAFCHDAVLDFVVYGA